MDQRWNRNLGLLRLGIRDRINAADQAEAVSGSSARTNGTPADSRSKRHRSDILEAPLRSFLRHQGFGSRREPAARSRATGRLSQSVALPGQATVTVETVGPCWRLDHQARCERPHATKHGSRLREAAVSERDARLLSLHFSSRRACRMDPGPTAASFRRTRRLIPSSRDARFEQEQQSGPPSSRCWIGLTGALAGIRADTRTRVSPGDWRASRYSPVAQPAPVLGGARIPTALLPASGRAGACRILASTDGCGRRKR